MRTASLLATFVVLAFSGCVEEGTGSASVYVKDAPTDEFDEIHVVFTKVEVHRSGGADGGANDSDDADGTDAETENGGDAGAETGNGANGADGETGNGGANSGWITLYENATGRDIDLLNVSGNRAAFLGETELEAGRYQQIRIHTTQAYGIKDGERTDFAVSSGVLKIARGFEVEADQETRIVLDIDLDGSLHEQGNGQWRMTPVIGKSHATVVDDDESGADVHTEGEESELDELDG